MDERQLSSMLWVLYIVINFIYLIVNKQSMYVKYEYAEWIFMF